MKLSNRYSARSWLKKDLTKQINRCLEDTLVYILGVTTTHQKNLLFTIDQYTHYELKLKKNQTTEQQIEIRKSLKLE